MSKDTDRQRVEQRGAELEDALRETVSSTLKDLHTALPGIIKSYDAATQTCTVQPALSREWIDDGVIALPLLVDVPVQFPQGGGLVITFPVAAGDECLVVFAERAIDNWSARGGVREAAEMRFHDLSDGFALMGFSSLPHAIPLVATDAIELRSRTGSLQTFQALKLGPLTLTWLNAVGAFCGAGPFPVDGKATKVKVE